jgi:hypothetical protein
MNQTGPILETLTHRLADTPLEFLGEPFVGGTGSVHVAALVNDLLAMHGSRAEAESLDYFRGMDARRDRNRLCLSMIVVWLLADPWFIAQRFSRKQLMRILREDGAELAAAAPAHNYVRDPDRREELARIALARLDTRPEGETVAQATDRLSSISGVERHRLVEASRAAQQRAREVREALARKAAEEAADKWTRD